MRERLRSRLNNIKGLPGQYSLLGDDEVTSVMTYARDVIQELSAPHLPARWKVERFDIYQMEPSAVRARLEGLPIEEDKVEVIWASDRAGVRLRYADFVHKYTELWRPSSDDVWVASARRTWLLEMDHEEVVTFAQLE
jgi:hypothetical protein